MVLVFVYMSILFTMYCLGYLSRKHTSFKSVLSKGWVLEKTIPYISNDNFSQEDIFDYWNGKLSGHAHVKRTHPDVVRMWRQFHGCPGSGVGIE
jgi:hypothetical protein